LHFAYGRVKSGMHLLKNTILFVDDDPDDLEFYGESLRTVEPSIRIAEARTGNHAMEYLKKAKEDKVLPCLIVLDVNMPRMGGKETLEEIKKDEDLLSIPVVIFSTASSPEEKEYFENHQVKFLTKPCSYSEMEVVAKLLLSYCA
jgi:CheY-like chemotaxis protein